MDPNPVKRKILVLDGVFAIHRLERKAIMDLASLNPGSFFSITFTDDEISVVTEEDSWIQGNKTEKNWKCLKVQGPLDFDQVGVIHGISEALMKAGVSIFVISTFNTDYFLVRATQLHNAVEALKKSDYEVQAGMGRKPVASRQ